MALCELTRGGEAAGACQQQRDALFARRRLREQAAERGPEPPRGARRREAGGRLAGLAQDLDGGEVALAGQALDVVGARRRRRAACRERLGASLVGAQPPAAPGGLVDPPSDQGVPEAKPPWHVRLADEIELQELVDGVHRRLLGRGRRGRGQLGLEGVTRHRGAIQHQARRLGQQCELLGQRGGDRRRHLDGQGQSSARASCSR